MDRSASTAPPPSPVLPGCEAWSHVASSSVGVVVVHGFTGTPMSVRLLAEEVAQAGFDVELPRLPGHGTSIDEMLLTRWGDWVEAVAEARARLAGRVEHVVLAGQSMGATLVLACALADQRLAGLICINPLTRLRDAETMEMLDDLIGDGITVVPGEGSDIASSELADLSYAGTPLVPLKSLLDEGVAPITHRFGDLTVPLRLFTSRQDHVVPPADSEHLARTYGGPVEHTWLERSFHVALLDFDRHAISAGSVAFASGFRR